MTIDPYDLVDDSFPVPALPGRVELCLVSDSLVNLRLIIELYLLIVCIAEHGLPRFVRRSQNLQFLLR
jgi:hypothetical protein